MDCLCYKDTWNFATSINFCFASIGGFQIVVKIGYESEIRGNYADAEASFHRGERMSSATNKNEYSREKTTNPRTTSLNCHRFPRCTSLGRQLLRKNMLMEHLEIPFLLENGVLQSLLVNIRYFRQPPRRLRQQSPVMHWSWKGLSMRL